MIKEAAVLDSMRGIIDPDLGKDIVSLGFIKDLSIDDGAVSFAVELTTPACPVKEQFKQACEAAVSALPGVSAVSVTMTAQARKASPGHANTGLSKVKHIIAVGSCKGGVGKSTVAVNLAFAIAASGAKVGIFDADIYGPSLTTMVKTKMEGLYLGDDKLIVPAEYEGVKLMSFGYVTAGPAILRGPIVTNHLNQLLTGTNWGELDYLILDMPPGTGDVQLTICQLLPVTAAVMVTTPQQISFVDVVKGIQMFERLKVPTVAVVENMSYFLCDGCDKRHEIFGSGAMRRLVDQFGFRNTQQIPIEPAVTTHGDSGRPLILAAPESASAAAFRDLANSTVREISTLLHNGLRTPQVTAEPHGIVVADFDSEAVISPPVLRRACGCAHCIDEMTHVKRLRDEDVSEDIKALKIATMGNYAVTIDWSDGHSSIFPYERLAKLTK
ncbi:MAG: Mrp family chromosome partitioning ATPase/DUF971 family protein [Rhodothermales bacterium]|jgi:Mrp family chromosome partitioning ATPase/DUF971 family protein